MNSNPGSCPSDRHRGWHRLEHCWCWQSVAGAVPGVVGEVHEEYNHDSECYSRYNETGDPQPQTDVAVTLGLPWVVRVSANGHHCKYYGWDSENPAAEEEAKDGKYQ